MKIKVKQSEENEIPTEILAQAIMDISAGMKKINSTRLGERALLILLNDASGVPKGDIKTVLQCLSELEKRYLKSATEKKK